MFPGERMQQVACCSGERHTLLHDFIVVERVYHNDKSKSEYLSNPP
ncbi:Uncharacterised protein [Klebsiella michiganensis]|nr:Uncharacterised protein [Klebsiella michiganensis]